MILFRKMTFIASIFGIILCTSCLNISLASQDDKKHIKPVDSFILPIYISENKIGFINDTGKTLIQPRYWYFHYGLSKQYVVGYKNVNKNGLAEQVDVINHTGEILFRVRDNVERVTMVTPDTIAIYRKSGFSGIKQLEGSDFKLCNNCKLSRYRSEISEDRVLFVANDNYGFMDSSGSIVIKPQYAYASRFKNGSAAVVLNKEWGFIAPNGSWIIKPQYENVNALFSKAGYATVSSKVGMYAIDKKGNDVFKGKRFPFLGAFYNGVARVKDKNGQWGIVSSSGTSICELKYEYIGPIADGLARFEKEDNGSFIVGILDVNGKELWGATNIKKHSSKVIDNSLIYNGYLWAETEDGGQGWIDTVGNWIWYVGNPKLEVEKQNNNSV